MILFTDDASSTYTSWPGKANYRKPENVTTFDRGLASIHQHVSETLARTQEFAVYSINIKAIP